MPDGLSMLDEKRKSRSRSIPAPRNPPRSTPVQVAELVPSAPVEAAAPAVEPETTAAVPAPTPAPKENPTAGEPTVQEPTIKMSIYLEASDDLYLEEITHAGKTSRPRIAISRSAIVRLALERLAATMTADEIVAQLRQTGDGHQGAGRKRR
ncbi:MAG: hypothetical protein LCH76_10005 [Actinobacteria bacterium]|nr:hypothetical protein [Actinomycetota bacterium]